MAKHKQHIKGFKGRKFADEIRNLDKEKILVIPIDCAKNSHKSLIANYPGDILVSPFEFDNTLSGVKMLDTAIKNKAYEIQAQKIIIGLEPTGVYYENLYFSLLRLGYDVVQVNPYSVSLARSMELNWCKTDERDLCVIGNAIINNNATETVLHSGLWYNLKQVARLHRAEIRYESALKNKIRSHMDRIFPGFQNKDIFSDFWCKASILLMENYPQPTQIINIGEKRLKNFLLKNNIRLTKFSIESLFAAAKNALVLSQEDLEIHLLDLQLKLRVLLATEENIRRFEIKMAELLVHTPAVLLLSIPYINVPSAAEFAAEMGPIADFRHARQVIKKAGTHSSKYQTGKYDSPNTPITKQGMSSLRNILSIIANNLNHNKYFKNWAEEFIEKGKSQNKNRNKHLVKTILCNKFVKISFSMMRHGQLFAPPDWNGDSLTDDPIAKLTKFLTDNGAEHLIDKLCKIAATQIN